MIKSFANSFSLRVIDDAGVSVSSRKQHAEDFGVLLEGLLLEGLRFNVETLLKQFVLTQLSGSVGMFQHVRELSDGRAIPAYMHHSNENAYLLHLANAVWCILQTRCGAH